MTAPISANRPMLPLSQTTSTDAVAKKAVLPEQSAPIEAGQVTAQKRLLPAQDTTAFEATGQVATRRAMPALLGSVADNPLQKMGKQALISNNLEVAGNALATAQAGLEALASIASRQQAQFAGLRNEAASALSGLSARMPMDIANSVAGSINGGMDMRQVDVLQGIAHTQGPLAAGNLEAGQYSADQLGQYGDSASYGDYGGYGGAVDPMSQFGGVADLAGGVADLAGGVADLGDVFRKPSSKPSAPESKPSAPESKPSAPESKTSAKPSSPDVKPSAPDIKPSSVTGKADDIAKGLLKTGGKALGRFVPGANIAIAGMDIANAVKTFKDPNASVGDKITSGIVAGGSALAATNIPIISQLGGAVSTGASIAGEVVKNFGGAIKDGAKKVGEGIKDVAEKVGDGIKDGAKKVGEGIKDTAKKVGEGIKDFFKGW